MYIVSRKIKTSISIGAIVLVWATACTEKAMWIRFSYVVAIPAKYIIAKVWTVMLTCRVNSSWYQRQVYWSMLGGFNLLSLFLEHSVYWGSGNENTSAYDTVLNYSRPHFFASEKLCVCMGMRLPRLLIFEFGFLCHVPSSGNDNIAGALRTFLHYHFKRCIQQYQITPACKYQLFWIMIWNFPTMVSCQGCNPLLTALAT